MRSAPGCRVFVDATVQNLEDLWAAKHGLLRADQVRCITIRDAFADAGTTMLCLPARLIHELGLTKAGRRRVNSSPKKGDADIYGLVRLTLQGRDCLLDVLAVPDDVPVLIGQVPLGRLDLVIDPQSRSLIGNPAHGGEQVIEAY